MKSNGRGCVKRHCNLSSERFKALSAVRRPNLEGADRGRFSPTQFLQVLESFGGSFVHASLEAQTQVQEAERESIASAVLFTLWRSRWPPSRPRRASPSDRQATL